MYDGLKIDSSWAPRQFMEEVAVLADRAGLPPFYYRISTPLPAHPGQPPLTRTPHVIYFHLTFTAGDVMHRCPRVQWVGPAEYGEFEDNLDEFSEADQDSNIDRLIEILVLHFLDLEQAKDPRLEPFFDDVLLNGYRTWAAQPDAALQDDIDHPVIDPRYSTAEDWRAAAYLASEAVQLDRQSVTRLGLEALLARPESPPAAELLAFEEALGGKYPPGDRGRRAAQMLVSGFTGTAAELKAATEQARTDFDLS